MAPYQVLEARTARNSSDAHSLTLRSRGIRSILDRSIPAALYASFALLGGAPLAFAQTVESPAPVSAAQSSAMTSVKIGPGESWLSVRARLCPVETLLAANPTLAERTLQPGDTVNFPYVATSEVKRVEALRVDAERRVEESLIARRQAEARVVDYESVQTQRDEAQASVSTWKTTAFSFQGITVVLGLLLAAAVAFALARTRDASAARNKLGETERRYIELRGALQRVDTEMQRRALKLLAGHGARVVSEAELNEAMRPVNGMVDQLRQRHDD